MNNLQASTDEILTKAKLALRSEQGKVGPSVQVFDESIGQKIVVPDASQCVRVVLASFETRGRLEQVVKGQKNEFRSPPFVIVWRGHPSAARIESDLLNWSDREVIPVRAGSRFLKPNSIYVVSPEMASQFLQGLKINLVSIQVLDPQIDSPSAWPKSSRTQLLLDESIQHRARDIENQLKLKLSDVTPATSFPSLSVEFFANLREVAV